MGTFDTIEFETPIKCNICDQEHTSVQTKMFGRSMKIYHIGDILPSHIVTGVLKDRFYCLHKDNNDEKISSGQDVYFVIWHHILIGVTGDYNRGEEKLKSFGSSDLYLLYQNLYRKYTEYRYKFRSIKSWTENYIEYTSLSEEEKDELSESETDLVNFDIKHFGEYLEESDDPFADHLKKLEKKKNFRADFLI